jgi:hypothetical protein
MPATLNQDLVRKLASQLGLDAAAEESTLDVMTESGLLPPEFHWQPSACFRVGDQYLLLHLLETRELPNTVLEAKALLVDPKVHVVTVATEVEEQLEDGIRILRPS